MASTQNTGKFISLGLIITIIGWLMLTGCCYVGQTLAAYPPLLVISSTAVTAIVSAVVMFFLVRSKTSASDMRNWMTVRIFSLIGASACVAYTAIPAMYTVNYAVKARVIGDFAMADVDSVRSMWNDFNVYEHERASATLSGLRNFCNSGTALADEHLTAYLRDYLSQQPNTVGEQTLASFATYHDGRIDGLRIGSVMWGDSYSARMEALATDASGLSPVALRRVRTDLAPFAEELSATLTRQSHSMQLPRIATQGAAAYTAYDDAPREYRVVPTAFAAAYDAIFAVSWQGIVLYAVIVFLYFFLFICSYSTRTGARRRKVRLSHSHGVKL